MQDILDYRIVEKLDDSGASSVYRAQKHDGEETFLIKVLKTEYPSPSEIARFKQECEIIRGVGLEGVVKTLDVNHFKGRFALVLEDFNGVTLKGFMKTYQSNIKTFLKIGVQLSETLGHLHKADVVHGGIRPRSILVNTQSEKVKITDFGIISEFTHENEEIYNPEVIREWLAYMSPEQTGRINRSVDYRTDLYSLGIVFYEMLTGCVPFESDDPLGMIYSHIARKPTFPTEIDSDIPQTISDIVMKLLSKPAEERYQNGLGLTADLEKCFGQLEHHGEVQCFELAQRDISIQFHIPEKIVGRDDEIALLMSIFDRVSRGKKEIMLVSGQPGVGKSALIHEIRKPIVAKKGYFISGKCEQLGRNLPYSSIVYAFQTLIRQVLTESKERARLWKKDLLKALGPNGKVITNVS